MDVPQLPNIIQMPTAPTTGPLVCASEGDTQKLHDAVHDSWSSHLESEMNGREILGKWRTEKRKDKRPSTDTHQRFGSSAPPWYLGTTLSKRCAHDALRTLHPMSDYYQKSKNTVCKWGVQTMNSKNWIDSPTILSPLQNQLLHYACSLKGKNKHTKTCTWSSMISISFWKAHIFNFDTFYKWLKQAKHLSNGKKKKPNLLSEQISLPIHAH